MRIYSEKVLRIVRKIPRGKSLSHKEVAGLAGSPNTYQAVGNILNKNFSAKGGFASGEKISHVIGLSAVTERSADIFLDQKINLNYLKKKAILESSSFREIE